MLGLYLEVEGGGTEGARASSSGLFLWRFVPGQRPPSYIFVGGEKIQKSCLVVFKKTFIYGTGDRSNSCRGTCADSQTQGHFFSISWGGGSHTSSTGQLANHPFWW